MGLGKAYSTRYLADSNNNTGAAGQVLISTSTGINWSDGSDIIGGPYLPVANPTFTGVLTGPYADLEFIKLTATNPGILMKETDVTDKNWDIQVNGGNLKLYEVNDARSVFSEKVTFKAGGNVGIGATDPGAKLELKKETTWGTLDNQVIYINNTGTGGDTSLIHDMGSITWRSGNVNTAAISGIRNTPGSGNNVDLRFTTATQSGGQQTSMTILSGGNVGIGQDTPLNSLDIYRATGDASIRIQAETASASTILKFRNQNSDADITVDQTTSNKARMVFTTDNVNGYVPVLSLEDNRDTLMYGNVGINNTSPDFKLDVGGTLGVSDLPFNSSSVSVLVADETIGAESVTNGDFATDTDWTKSSNVSISGGQATFTANGVAQFIIQGSLWPANSLSGQKVKLTYTVISNNLNAGDFRIGGYTGASAFTLTGLPTTVGTHNVILDVRTSAGDDNAIDLYVTSAATSGALVIDNVSVKQVTSASDQIQKSELNTIPRTNPAASLYDLIPNGAFTTTYAFTSTAGTYAEVMSGDDVITATGTYSVQMIVNDFAVGGTQYDEKYSGVMSWHHGSANDNGVGAISEIALHRSGHAGNQGITYLRTRETTNSADPGPNELKLEIMCNRTYTGASNVIFKFVRLI